MVTRQFRISTHKKSTPSSIEQSYNSLETLIPNTSTLTSRNCLSNTPNLSTPTFKQCKNGACNCIMNDLSLHTKLLPLVFNVRSILSRVPMQNKSSLESMLSCIGFSSNSRLLSSLVRPSSGESMSNLSWTES